ncbi:hypothetical protein BKG63_10960 [Mycobacteroides chelonae]|uniref:DUF3850 domain-containing protein n=1 Tax=Mycobacteroides chelonae TaxID=1774 RepID=UPI0008A91841|nr:DUF3850 domain-containing protein [Mycobacteroides chelonae]OHT52549.1 hypothetical protein BKG63_10960 [Mycobacteroides chelonae]
MTQHDVKITDHYYSILWNGSKTCELRRDDRDYQIGDTIRFATPGARYYSMEFRVTHVLKNFTGLEPGYVVLSLEHPDAQYERDSRERLAKEVDRLGRSNAGLRDQITKLRKQIGGDR